MNCSSEEEWSQSEESEKEIRQYIVDETMLETTVLILIKLKWSPKFKDASVCIKEGVGKNSWIDRKWANNSKIAAIINFGSNAIREDFANSIDY